MLCVSVQWPSASQVPERLRCLVEACLEYDPIKRPTMLAVTAALTAILNSLRGVSFTFATLDFRALPVKQHLPRSAVQCSVGILQALSAVLQRFLFWSAHPFYHQHTTVKLAQM